MEKKAPKSWQVPVLDLVIPHVRALRARVLRVVLAAAFLWLVAHACVATVKIARLESDLRALQRDMAEAGLFWGVHSGDGRGSPEGGREP